MELTAISLSCECTYSKPTQELTIAAASLSLFQSTLHHESFVSISLENSYSKPTQELTIAAASLSLFQSTLHHESFVSMSLTSAPSYVQIIDMIKGITITII